MRHIELHLIESLQDEHLADAYGLDVYVDESCVECESAVGPLENGKFVPYVMLLDDKAEWAVCADCAKPVL